jgi:hypothetical protein
LKRKREGVRVEEDGLIMKIKGEHKGQRGNEGDRRREERKEKKQCD